MNKITLEQWVEITRESGMPLYAVLTKTGASQAVAEYYRHDGSHTPYGLYARTPYADWFSVMPMIVSLSENSPFLSWVSETEHKDWGWLARSPFTMDLITEHLRGLTQVIMPDGEEVFFRYWDGEYMAEHLRYFGDDWRQILPAFPFYWMNGEYFTVHISAHNEAKAFPWWQVPQALINTILTQKTQPILLNIMQILKDDHPELYGSYSTRVIKTKVAHLLSVHQDAESVLTMVLQQLTRRG